MERLVPVKWVEGQVGDFSHQWFAPPGLAYHWKELEYLYRPEFHAIYISTVTAYRYEEEIQIQILLKISANMNAMQLRMMFVLCWNRLLVLSFGLGWFPIPYVHSNGRNKLSFRQVAMTSPNGWNRKYTVGTSTGSKPFFGYHLIGCRACDAEEAWRIRGAWKRQ